MRCRARELAVIVKSDHPLVGRIVRCDHLAQHGEIIAGRVFPWSSNQAWVIEHMASPVKPGVWRVPVMPDEWLCPLRARPGVDPTLVWFPTQARNLSS